MDQSDRFAGHGFAVLFDYLSFIHGVVLLYDVIKNARAPISTRGSAPSRQNQQYSLFVSPAGHWQIKSIS